jgi:hypothetical protein
MGWTYNTTDPDAPTIGPMITGVAIALTVISFLTVCLRVYVRGFLIKAFGIGMTPPVPRENNVGPLTLLNRRLDYSRNMGELSRD